MKKFAQKLYAEILPKLVGLGLNVYGLFAPYQAAELALDIFRSPRKGKIASYQRKFLKKFNKRVLDYEGMPIMTYNDGREGKKVLLCHGWESNSYRWRKLYKVLAQSEMNVIMMDAPAHGESGSDKFDAIIYAKMIDVVSEHFKPEVVVGHSVGGYAVMLYGANYDAEYLKKMIIMASGDKLEDTTKRYFKKIGLGKRVAGKYKQLITDKYGHPIEYYAAASFATSIKQDGLIIHDLDDEVNIFYEAEAIHAHWENSNLVPTQKLGHSLQGDKVYQTISNFIG